MEHISDSTQLSFIMILLLGVSLSILSGIVGPFVLASKTSSLIGSVSHAILAGVGVAVYFDWNQFVCILVFGIVLVLSLLSLPSAIAIRLTKVINQQILYSIVLAMIMTFGRLQLSFLLYWPIGATITLFSGICYLPFLFHKKINFLEIT